MPSVGVIGLGLLGSALAQRFLQARIQVLGFDLEESRRSALEDQGGQALASSTEVAERCDQIVLSLPTSDVVGNLVASWDMSLSGKIILDTTTGDPHAMDAIGQELAQRGAGYVAAMVAGSSAQVRQGDVVVILGGEERHVLDCENLIQAFAREWFYVGPWSAAVRMKLIVNLVLGLNRAVLAEGLAFASACGIDPAPALTVLMAGPAFSRVMETKGRKMVERDFALQARLAQHLKDVRLILQEGATSGARLPLSKLHESLLAELVAAGLGESDNSAILEAFRPK